MLMNEKQNGITNDFKGLYKAQRVCQPPGPVNRAEHPKGQATANMVLATFAETKVARLPGRDPALLPPPTNLHEQ